MSDSPKNLPRGRATAGNPQNRFERLSVEWNEEEYGAGPERVATSFLRDSSRSIIATNQSPDVPFDASLNPYRGCEHGCAYCYARPTHEYLGFSAGLDFETRILVKEDAPELLRKELASRSWVPKPLGLSGVTDCYQPIERKLEITRRCLEVLAAFRNPVMIVTKNALIRRDLDHLQELARHQAVGVMISVTTLDGDLARILEPRASHPRDRLAAIKALHEGGVPVGVLVAPVIPAITDHEIPRILAAAAAAGAENAGFTLLRLPGAVEAVFDEWLVRHFPDRRDKVLSRLREARGGQLSDSRFGHRMRGDGVYAEQISALFHHARKKVGIAKRGFELSTAGFRRLREGQMELFGGPISA